MNSYELGGAMSARCAVEAQMKALANVEDVLVGFVRWNVARLAAYKLLL